MTIRDYLRRPLWPACCVALALLAAAAYLYRRRIAPDGLTGGSFLGLWYGLLGYLCFVAVAAVLPWHRRLVTRPGAGRVGRLLAAAPRSAWLRGHLWLSVLGSVLILCHCGGRLGGRVECVLMAAFALTMLTGAAGVAIQTWVPRLLSRGGEEIPPGQLPTRCELLRRRADEAFDRLLELARPPETPGEANSSEKVSESQGALETLYEMSLRRHLHESYPLSLLWADPFPAFQGHVLAALPAEQKSLAEGHLASLRQEWQKRREYGKQQWLHASLHAWLYAHVPASAAMLALGLWHGVVSVWF